LVFDIWRSYFDFSHYEETSFYEGERAKIKDPERLERLFNWIRHSIKHTPILLPNNEIWRWIRNGFGSGYQQTQLMDTFGNAIVIATCLAAMGIKIEAKEFFCRIQGDDSIATFFEHMFIIYGTNFLFMLHKASSYYFNTKLNIKKSKITSNFEDQMVLGYKFIYDMPYRSVDDLLSHFLFPESQYDSMDRKASVCIGLAYATCGTNERFYDFMKSCFIKLIKRGAEPKERYLIWLKRSGVLLDADFDLSHFPDRIQMLNWQFSPWIRTKFEYQRVWPTEEGSRGRFYFLEK